MWTRAGAGITARLFSLHLDEEKWINVLLNFFFIELFIIHPHFEIDFDKEYLSFTDIDQYMCKVFDLIIFSFKLNLHIEMYGHLLPGIAIL